MNIKPLKESFNTWWIKKGRNKADIQGGKTCDLNNMKQVFWDAWRNGAFIERINNA
jgi:hypothetical protein